MKKYTTMLILAVLAFATAAFAQPSEPVPTEQLMRIQAEVSTGDVTAFFEESVTVAGKKYPQPWVSVSWNASDETVTVNGQTMTYSQVMQLVVAIAMKEREAQKNPPPAPEPEPESGSLTMSVIKYVPAADGINYRVIDAQGNEIGQTLVAALPTRRFP